MTAHGTDPNEVNEETFNDICLMFSDGLIGNYRIIETLGNLTAGVYNYMRSATALPYKLQDIIPTVYEYLYPPLSEEEKKNAVSKQLIAFAMMHPGAPKELVERYK